MATQRRTIHPSGTTVTTIFDLPRDVLLLIVTRLSHNQRLNLSLVSKSFRSLTSSFVYNLRFNSVPSRYAIRKLLARFSSVNHISVYTDTMTRVLKRVAQSGLKIELLRIFGRFDQFPKMEKIVCLSGKFDSVKSLELDSLSNAAAEQELVDFILLLFPSLQQLVCCVCSTISDFGVEKLAHKSLNLRKINLGWISSSALTNRALEALTKCVNLEHVSLMSWGGITLQDFCAFLRKKKRSLKSLELPNDHCRSMMERPDDLHQLVETISLCENLSHLRINNYIMKDSFLRIIARSRSPLTSLEVEGVGLGNTHYTMTGMAALLMAFQGLTRLRIDTPLPVLDNADMEITRLVKCLPRLKELFFTLLFDAYATLFSLIQNCPLLEIIHVDSIVSDYDFDLPQEIKKNYSVKCIILYPEPVSAVKVALKLACPSLEIFKFQPLWSNE